ncbi:MAG: aspartate dehydrogenase domain-containing protein [Sutterella wadsworthensis]
MDDGRPFAHPRTVRENAAAKSPSDGLDSLHRTEADFIESPSVPENYQTWESHHEASRRHRLRCLGHHSCHELCQGRGWTLTGVMARTKAHAEALAANAGCRAAATLEELLADKPDLVVEIAGIGAAKAYGEAVLEAGCDFVLVSAGALADADWKARMTETALRTGRRIHVASGAIGGFDVLRTAAPHGRRGGDLREHQVPEEPLGAPGLMGVELPADRETLAFEGGVEEAVRGFPKNINVAAATVSAADAPNVRVRLVARPGLTVNTHHIDVKAGEMHCELFFHSAYDPKNPRSSTSTAWSVPRASQEPREPDLLLLTRLKTRPPPCAAALSGRSAP